MTATLQHNPPETRQLAKLVDGKRIVMLTTFSPDGRLQSKPMTVLAFDDEGCFWFYVEHDAQDGAAAQRYHRVNLAFSDESVSTFISVPGHGELVHERERIHALWTPLAKPWFPDGPDSPRLALLKVTPDGAEYWDAPNSRFIRGLAIAASIVSGQPIGVGEHEVLPPNPRPAAT
ncbi:pyridoxamine 5'-phosphate oxidase family protein [Aquabacterium sp.]|uniref:pyridoxamine 5'-phosphate oxidase family protein n=1 Tax=Aquabacterium sp. TaxID=1872578 RepID=UPI002CC33FEF|nr:pyridoxamine 5'-phosphate oxidase family protein [Aquabacterium sp.]HSW04632.1 pyridoxamine 5'-phosphate oxidase family protein [Aquabacterium sp.]